MHLVFNGIITISDAAHHEASWEGRIIDCLSCDVADSVLLHMLAHLLMLLPVFLLPVKRAVTRRLALAALHFRHMFPLSWKSLSREADGQNRWNRSEEELDEPALTLSLLIGETKITGIRTHTANSVKSLEDVVLVR